MDQCTENFECLVIHNGSKSNKIEDQVFWYKASGHEDFKLGSKDLWKNDTGFHAAGWLTGDDVNMGGGGRRGGNVRVERGGGSRVGGGTLDF